MPGTVHLRYSVPMHAESPIPGRNAEDIAQDGSVLSTCP